MTTYRSHVNEDGSISCTVNGMPVEEYVIETAKKLAEDQSGGGSPRRDHRPQRGRVVGPSPHKRGARVLANEVTPQPR